MRTLEQIREANKRQDMLLTGMETKYVQLPPDAIREGKDFYKNIVKPAIQRVVKRQLAKKIVI